MVVVGLNLGFYWQIPSLARLPKVFSKLFQKSPSKLGLKVGSVSGLKSEYGKHRTYYTCVAQFWVICMCFSLQRFLSNTNHLVSLNASLIFLGHSRHLPVLAFPLAIYSAWNVLPVTPIKLTQIFTKMYPQWGLPWHTTKIESPSRHSLFSPFPSHFFLFWGLFTIWNIIYFLVYLAFNPPSHKNVHTERAEISLFFVHCFIPNAKKLPRHKRCLTDVLNEWIRSNLTNRIFLLDGVILLFLHKS